MTSTVQLPPGTRISPMVIKKQRDQTFAAFPIGLVEAREEWAVEIEHPQDDTALDQRDDEFRARIRIASDVARKIVDIRDQDCRGACR